jgi:chemotaxis protein histidine kinase CheA
MPEGAGFLEFFILEASDYVGQLDGLLLAGGSGGPDPNAVQRVARALRGTATMAKLPAFADLAAAIERVGRAMHDRRLTWDPPLRGALAAAIDDLKKLLHSARRWSSDDDRRAGRRIAELSHFAPPLSTGTPADAAHAALAAPFLSREASNIAAGLELLTTPSTDAETGANVLRRIRALRGVAGVNEIVPFATALEATEKAGRALESGYDALTPEARRLLQAAAIYMRSLASALRMGSDLNAPTAARNAFDTALEAWNAAHAGRDRVVPIASLFYADGSGVVETAKKPRMSAAERFRLELVSLGERLRQVVDAARTAKDPEQKVRAQHELKRSLEVLEAAAESFGEPAVAAFVRSHAHATTSLDSLSISALSDLAALLAEPGVNSERLRARLSEAARRPAPAAPVAEERTTGATEGLVGSKLDHVAAALIDSGISALESVASKPLMPATEFDEAVMVPIDSLLYRGRAALDRAVEIRDQLRRVGPSTDPEALEELFDLLELARAE